MSTIVTVYSATAFKRFLLPAINNANHSILLSSAMFNLEKNIELKLEIIDKEWHYSQSCDYELRKQNQASCFGEKIHDGDIVKLFVCEKAVLSVIVKETDHYFSVYSKYDIQDIHNSITIGSAEDNVIVYNDPNLIAARHANIHIGNQSAYFEDLGGLNGSFVNSRRVIGSIPLSFGDCIDIYGLRIVYLSSFLAVNVSEFTGEINEDVLHPREMEVEKLSNGHYPNQGTTFHRSPRHIAKILNDSISIEEAPQPKVLNQPSMFMTIAPSLTMALPMILGCALMIWAANRENMGYSSLYQYIGLMTAILSTAIGVVWAIVAQKGARKQYQYEQDLRNKKYREYLNKKEQIIKEAYEHNRSAMYDRYKSADECCGYDVNNSALWNRNSAQEDFLLQRLGIGETPFQVDIRIPAEKFSMIEDKLMELPAKIRNTYAVLQNVPICVNLLQEKLIGIVGGKNMQGAVSVAQAMIAQIVANNSYTDVKLVIIYDEKKSYLNNSWEFAKWLPHVWNETRTFRYVSSNKEEASEVFYELTKKFRFRTENAIVSGNEKEKEDVPKPYYIIVLANPAVLEGELISKYLFDRNPVYGVSTLVLAENCESLPNECEFVLENTEQFSGMYRLTDNLEERVAINFDPISSVMLEQLATNLANIKVHEVESGGDVPNSRTFFDMYGVTTLAEFNVLDRWRKNRTYESMKALIGEKAGSVPCYLDVHEKYHGPHGLVAGTTGSGKSETLQTYILSLCINFSPKDIALFIIDYKGGGMGNLFTDLPHMIGQISNLSGNQIHRALVSIKSEKDRRQRIFNEYGVNNINSYTKLYKNNEAKLPVPHLFIIIDEFAEMKRDEPDFIQELVSVSQVGRSLGIHLIMATQKPAGTVDDNIWSNSRFKLCLRVQDRQDSMDMLHRPDAAYIIQAGRCYMQVGNDEIFELFQSGWSGAEYSEDAADLKVDVAKMLAVNGVPALEGSRAKIARKYEEKRNWIEEIIKTIVNILDEMGTTLEQACMVTEKRDDLLNRVFNRLRDNRIDYPLNEANEKSMDILIDICLSEGLNVDAVIALADKMNKKIPQQTEKTQLDAVVGYLKELAQTYDYLYDFSLFLPLLPENLLLSDLPPTTVLFNDTTSFDGNRWCEHMGDWSLEVPMGLFDDPENQRQDVYGLDLAKSGNVAIVGSLATGKSTFLQTFLYGLTVRYSPEEVNIYAIDFSAKMMSAFEHAPHVGGILYEEDTEKIAIFFSFLSRLLEARKKLLKGGSFEQYITVHGHGAIPAVVIVIDNYSGFQSKAGITEENEEFMLQLSKEGVSYGIFLITTSAGFGYEELPNRMAENFRTTISLELNDSMGYTEIMRRNTSVYPEMGIKGRGIAVIEGAILEFQTALCMNADSDYERSEKIRELLLKMSEAWGGKHAKEIPEIPEKPVWNEFIQLDETQEMLLTDRFLPMGYESRYADVFGIDLSKIYTYLITGNKRKGKTNLLKELILSASKKGGRVVVIDYASKLTKICEYASAECITTEEQLYHFLSDFLPDFESRNMRKHELIDQGLDEEEVYLQMQEFSKVYFFVDDLSGFIEKTYSVKENPEEVGEYHELLEQIVDYGILHNIYWFACLNKNEVNMADSYLLYDLFTREKKGIHLGGMTDNSTLNFDNLPYQMRDQVTAIGRGLLPVDNEDNAQEVVIPLVKWSTL